MYNPSNGQSKGVGFNRFDQRQEAEVAVSKLNATMPDGCLEPIAIKFANYSGEIKTDSFCPLPADIACIDRLASVTNIIK